MTFSRRPCLFYLPVISQFERDIEVPTILFEKSRLSFPGDVGYLIDTSFISWAGWITLSSLMDIFFIFYPVAFVSGVHHLPPFCCKVSTLSRRVDDLHWKAFQRYHGIQVSGQEWKRDINAAGLAQTVERLTAEREVASSFPGAGPIPRVLKYLRNEGTPLHCKRLDLRMARMTM